MSLIYHNAIEFETDRLEGVDRFHITAARTVVPSVIPITFFSCMADILLSKANKCSFFVVVFNEDSPDI